LEGHPRLNEGCLLRKDQPECEYTIGAGWRSLELGYDSAAPSGFSVLHFYTRTLDDNNPCAGNEGVRSVQAEIIIIEEDEFFKFNCDRCRDFRVTIDQRLATETFNRH